MSIRRRPVTRRVLMSGVAVASLALAVLVVVPAVVHRSDDDRSRPTHVVGRVAARSSASVHAAAPAPPSDAAPEPPRILRSVVRQVRPCAHNVEDKLVLVSLADQHVWLCARHRAVAGFPVTSGRASHDDATPTGTYAVQALTRDTTLNPDGGGAFHVRYWIPFKWGMYGFHDAPWQTIPFGSRAYRTSGSRGCVHMRTHDIARLFHWVALGTVVRVLAGPVR